MKKYELANLEGCMVETTECENIEEAKSYFANFYTGEYKLIPLDEVENLTIGITCITL